MSLGGKRSRFNLALAAHYLRLGFQSMTRDQDEAAADVKLLMTAAGDDRINQILGLAGLCAGRARRIADEEERRLERVRAE